MKKKLTRLTALVVVVLCVLAAAGCSGTSSVQPSGQASAAPAASGSQTVNAEQTAKTSEPVELTLFGVLDAKIVSSGVQTDPVAQYIEDKLGVRMNIEVADQSGDLVSKMAAMIATNALPDIMYFPDANKQLMNAEKANELLPINDYLNANSSLNTVPINKFSNAYYEKNLSTDGKLYGLGTLKGAMGFAFYPDVSNFIRWDLYKQLGYPEIKTWNDLLTVLKQMQDLEPTTKDGKKNYGVGAWFGDSGLDFIMTYMPGYTNGVLTLGSCWEFDAKTNDISPNDIFTNKQSSFWQCIQWVNKAYQMGLLDPNSFTQKYDQYYETATAGRYMWVPQCGTALAATNTFKTNGEADKGFVALTAMSQDAFIRCASAPTGQQVLAIAKTCKYPEKAVQLIDFFNSYDGLRIVFNGVEGTNWTMKDGKPTPTDEFLKMEKLENDFIAKTGTTKYNFFAGLAGATVDPASGTTLDMRTNITTISNVYNDAAQHYSVDVTHLYDRATVKTFSWDVPSAMNDAATKMTDDMKAKENTMINYIANNSRAKLVRAKDDAAFAAAQDQFISDLKAMGLDDIFQYYKNADSSIQQMYKELLTETGYNIN